MGDRVLKRAMDQRRVHVFFLYEFKLGHSAVKAEHLYKYILNIFYLFRFTRNFFISKF